MTIETKYNVGDEVWFQYDRTEPICGTIENKAYDRLFNDDSQGWVIRISNGTRIVLGESGFHANQSDALLALAVSYESWAKELRDKARIVQEEAKK